MKEYSNEGKRLSSASGLKKKWYFKYLKLILCRQEYRNRVVTKITLNWINYQMSTFQ